MKARLSTISDSPLFKEWHSIKNIDLDPSKLTLGSTKRVWWLCSKGHEWEAVIGSRRKRGCPKCSNRLVSSDNSLATKFPELIRYWDFVRNENLNPTEIIAGGHKEVWWKCEKSHSFQAQVRAIIKVFPKFYCPTCLGRTKNEIPFEQSFLAKYPELSKQWHPSRNGDLTPDKVLAGSEKKIWWICLVISLHEWEATIYNRINGSGCPYCINKAVDSTNSLAALFPELCDEWHKAKNGITPDDVVAGSAYPAWWKCKKCHYEWSAVVRFRTGLGNGQKYGCPACSNHVATVKNSLQTLHPEIAAQWHPTKNGDLRPTDVVAGSATIVWWQCPKSDEHEWEQQVRARKLYGCPWCDHKKITVTDSILTTHPEIAKEWHPTKNGNLLPSQMSYGHDAKCWWQCKKDQSHVWEATIYNRVVMESGCPFCYNLGYTRLEKFVEKQLGISRCNKIIFTDSRVRPDFKLSDSLYLNVDGLYWHSALKKVDNYHHWKMREIFESHGCRILQFYEDEVYDRWTIIESIISNALGNVISKVGARECSIESVSHYESDRFYIENHLLGTTLSGTLGLKYAGKFVAMMSVTLNSNKSMLLDRFAGLKNTVVNGAFTKLLNAWITKLHPKRVISLCDLRYATGKSYEQSGFKLVSIDLGYCWTKGNKRYNRRFCVSDSNQTEAQRAVELGVRKIYDAGKAKYILEL